ncbi:MAG: ATP-dependent DNA helicase RecG, partial [Elusimicrobia bacterium]
MRVGRCGVYSGLGGAVNAAPDTPVAPESVLDKPAQYLKGVGPKRAELLARLGLVTVGDLANHLPRAWEDRSETPPGRGVPAEAPLVLRGRVKDSFQRRAGPHLTLLVARVAVLGHGE